MNLQYRGYRGVLAVVALVASFGWVSLQGCATTSDNSSTEEDEFIGQPPSPEDDPFSVRGDVRAEAVEATPRGEISEDDFEEPTPRDDLEANPDEWDEALGSAKSGEESGGDTEKGVAAESTPDEPKQRTAAKQETEKPTPDGPDVSAAEAKPEPERPSNVRCFSCVKICPIDGDCASAKTDVICGWGAHSTRDQAARLARAECDATLDMARQMPVWSRIEGQCPAATCRE